MYRISKTYYYFLGGGGVLDFAGAPSIRLTGPAGLLSSRVFYAKPLLNNLHVSLMGGPMREKMGHLIDCRLSSITTIVATTIKFTIIKNCLKDIVT